MKTIYVRERCYKNIEKYGKALVLWNAQTSNNKRSEDNNGQVENGDVVNIRYCRKGGIKSIPCKLSCVNFEGELASANATKHKIKESVKIRNVEMTHRGGCGELHFHNCNVTIHISK